jgi:hypothetical protein
MAKSKPQTKSDARMADLLDRQDGVGKYAPKKNNAINNSVKKMQTGSKIEEQYQKQKTSKIISRKTEMDKIKTPYPKGILKKFKSN